jgi:PAS domain-containing protein
MDVPQSVTDLAGLRLALDDVLSAVLTTVGQPIWIIGPDGVIRFANPAAVSAF